MIGQLLFAEEEKSKPNVSVEYHPLVEPFLPAAGVGVSRDGSVSYMIPLGYGLYGLKREIGQISGHSDSQLWNGNKWSVDKDQFIALTFLPLNRPREAGATWDPQRDVDESMVPITLHFTPEYAETFARILSESVKESKEIFRKS